MAKIRSDLVGSVLIGNPKGGDPIMLVAGSKVPEGIELGDHVLEPKSTDDAEKAAKDAAKAAKKAGPSATADLTVPPQSGRGSGDAAWHAYATAAAEKAGLQIEIPADAKKADIIEALKGANIPVE